MVGKNGFDTIAPLGRVGVVVWFRRYGYEDQESENKEVLLLLHSRAIDLGLRAQENLYRAWVTEREEFDSLNNMSWVVRDIDDVDRHGIVEVYVRRDGVKGNL